MKLKQIAAVKQLLADLKSSYRIEDNLILPHCQVAYGSPNQYNKRNHRPRRRCAMLLGRVETRKQLGLMSRPGFDPDMAAGRLVKSTDADTNVALNYLYERLEKPIDNGKDPPEEKAVVKVIGKDGDTAWAIAEEEYNSKSTIYLFPDGLVRTGEEIIAEMRKPDTDKKKLKININYLPKDTTVFVGYTYGGIVTLGKSASDITEQWNYPTTYYIMPNKKIKSGDDINPKKNSRKYNYFV